MVDHVHCNQKWNLVSHVLVLHTKIKPCWLGFHLGWVTVDFFSRFYFSISFLYFEKSALNLLFSA